MVALWVDMKSYVGFSARDAEFLRALRPVAQAHFPRIVNEFYDRLLGHPPAKAVLTGGPAQIERLRHTMLGWMDSALAGPHDDAFFEQRTQIGRRHVQVGLPQRYMFTAMNVIRIAFHELVEKEIGSDRDRALATHNALDRLFDLELAIMLQTYQEDLSDLVRRRERLAAEREGELQLETLVETVQALLLVLDCDGRILHANPALAAATGVPCDQLVSAVWVDEFVHAEDRTPFRNLLGSVQKGAFATTHESRILRRNATGSHDIRWVQWQAANTETAGGDRRIYVSGLDVTELRELKRRAGLSEKLAAVGTLTAGLAHEIRNPLNGANLQLELLRRRLAAVPDNERMQEIVTSIGNEIGRLSRIVEDFLAFASPPDFMPEQFDLARLIRQSAELELDQARRRHVTMEVDIPEAAVEFRGDCLKLQEVVSNLLRNALEAVSEAGHVKVSVRTTDEAIRLDITDNGPGIPSQNLDRIFEPFFSTKPMGTGLGLAIGHSFVELHGGRITVRSPAANGAGTTVSVHLPRGASSP